ncbi:hypothetical protein HPP92_018638 [Vanilla planifolia]|uniref:Protein kinase domain-containing protein n=1 Tax=Vanilla planifolia TaxID=51239 RepID=A0A835QA59_VANPL|nr:hypothetical protein HPP92_018638 [Vanilla planifolia]
MSNGGRSGAYSGGRVVGDYIFGRQIGSGSFSVVWLARHRVHHIEVAVKEIVIERLSKKLQESLLSEIVILKRIKHPNIIAMHDIIEASGRIYLILEYCRGGDLSLYIQRHGRVSEVTAKHFMQQLANGLKVLRENNLIHRDLKPQNLLLSTTDEKSVLKIADFGFARSLQPLGLAETLCGSPLYMAPEIMKLQKYDAKADLWSVGAILFQLVTGKTPFTGNNQIQLLQNIVKSHQLHFPSDNNLSNECLDLCKRMLRQNPVERLTFEEFFNHPFLLQRTLYESLSQTSCIAFAGCTTGRSPNDQEDCMTFPLENESSRPDLDVDAPMHRSSIRSIYGFTIGAEKDSSSNPIMNLGILPKHSLPNKMDASGYGQLSCRQLSGDIKQTNVSSKGDKNVGDSLDSVDQDYVIISDSHLELSSSSLSVAESRNSPGKSENVPAMGSLESNNSPASGISQGSMDIGEDIEEPSANFITRIRLLQQCASALTELVNDEIENEKRLEAFSVQLVLLAIWKQALNVCHVQPALAADGSPSPENKSLGRNNNSTIELCFSSSESLLPGSISSGIEREFLLSVEQAEKLEKELGQVDEATEMPDAVEIIFQAALSLGRLGAVDEMMKNVERAEVRYSKAMCLLHFLLVEAPSLALNPPLTLTNKDRKRLRSYIEIISNRHNQSRSQRMIL